MSLWRIQGGNVYDPLHGVDGAVQDLWIESGKIVPPPTDPAVRPVKTIDARGMVVMPGGVDLHTHIVGGKVNAARRLQPEAARAGTPYRKSAIARSGVYSSVPTTAATGYAYAGLGYTAAFDAAIAPFAARHAHEEFDDTPCIDAGCYLLAGNNHYVLDCLKAGDASGLRDFVAWLLTAAKGYAIKVVNPGGIEIWKSRHGATARSLDERVDHFDVTPRGIIQGLAQAIEELRLPHPIHIHCNNLGMPGNWRTTLETMRSLEGRRGHLTHIQFHSYGGGDEDDSTFSSKTAELVAYVNAHPNLSIDVGQVMFGKTTSMTGDGPLGYYLHRIYGGKWISADTELESGCGIVPIEYKERDLVHGLQWAIGLEWYLLVTDPWRVVMSTDHPNGGVFLTYPKMIRLLMDREYRRECLAKTHPKVLERCQLADLDREYSLSEICIITRAGPAKLLGLAHKGHLGIGADADLAIYQPQADREAMFSLPRYTIKAGEIILEDGELRASPAGERLFVTPPFDPDRGRAIERWCDANYTIRAAQYQLADGEIRRPRGIPIAER